MYWAGLGGSVNSIIFVGFMEFQKGLGPIKIRPALDLRMARRNGQTDLWNACRGLYITLDLLGDSTDSTTGLP